MVIRYASLPNSLAPDAEHELDAAFESDDEDDRESTPLNPRDTSTAATTADSLTRAQTSTANAYDGPGLRETIPGAYDFEADPFDYAAPPPGSPPGPSTVALPNQYGNSNGLLPSNPAVPRQSGRRLGFFGRAVGVLLPTHYQQVATGEGPPGPARGGGTNNDGVFANLTAKPGRGRIVQEGDSIHVVPEEVQKEAPPSYAVAQADSAPAYYETIVHTQASGLDGEVLVDAMPTGSIFTFAWTMLISLSFQFVGFLLTYLLHTTHAAKFGSRAGLGITIVQYAFFLRRRAAMVNSESGSYDESQSWFESNASPGDDSGGSMSAADFNGTVFDANAPPDYPLGYPPGYFTSKTTEFFAFLLMTLGWCVLLYSLLGFWRVKRWERGIRQANDPAPPPSPEQLERDMSVRSSLLRVFGIPLDGEEGRRDSTETTHGPNGEPLSEEEMRLARDLRASGLL